MNDDVAAELAADAATALVPALLVSTVSLLEVPHAADARQTSTKQAPTTGSYLVGGRDGFRGTVEVYSAPQREFDITTGDLVITSAEGDVLSGTFSITAVERAEEFGAPTVEIRVGGSFRTQPPD